MSKLSAFDRLQERDMAYLPYGSKLLSAQELASRYRGLLTMYFRQFVSCLRPWAIYEHKNLSLQSKDAVLCFLRLRARKACEPPLKNHLEKIDNKLHEHWDDDEDENQNPQNSCVRSVSTGAHKLNPNVELTGCPTTKGEAEK